MCQRTDVDAVVSLAQIMAPRSGGEGPGADHRQRQGRVLPRHRGGLTGGLELDTWAERCIARLGQVGSEAAVQALSPLAKA